MTIHIEALTFDTIIGLLDLERDNPQKVIVDITLKYNYKNEDFIDYADIVLLIKNKLHEERYTLLEDALLGIKSTLYSTYPQLQSISLKITKPNILSDCLVALSNSWDFTL